MFTKVTLEDVLREAKLLEAPYSEQYAHVSLCVKEGLLEPVKSSPRNGKTPSLHLRYRRYIEEKDTSALKEELKYHLDPSIQVHYYERHIEVYESERKAVRRLSDFLMWKRDLLSVAVSCNERSFQIFGDEKFISEHGGTRVCAHCGVSLESLNFYSTVEPIAYCSFSRDVPQNVLFIENKDTFYSIRRFLSGGCGEILGLTVGTLIYGGGKRILSSLKEFSISVEPHVAREENIFFYFGDLDYEGIRIYESVCDVIGRPIAPFCAAYCEMLRAGSDIELPHTLEGQNRDISPLFFSFFDEATSRKMREILESDRYIPQEILTFPSQ